jgi:uncharacterized membrane protein
MTAHPGPWRGRADPSSSKSNPHWARMYRAKRRAIDIALLKEAERMIALEERDKDEARDRLARAFGRPQT